MTIEGEGAVLYRVAWAHIAAIECRVIWCISIGAKGAVSNGIVSLDDSPKLAVCRDVFPDDVPIGCDLEKVTIAALTDQCVAIGLPLGTADVGAEEIEEWELWIGPIQ